MWRYHGEGRRGKGPGQIIAIGTTNPGYWVQNLNYLCNENEYKFQFNTLNLSPLKGGHWPPFPCAPPCHPTRPPSPQCQLLLTPILIVIVFVFAFVIVFMLVMFSHHSDQMSQRSRCQGSLCVLQNQKVSVTEMAKKWMSKGREIIECVNIWIWTRGHQKLW